MCNYWCKLRPQSFGLKLLIHAHFEGFGGTFSPNDVTHRPNLQKDRLRMEACRLSHKA